ncbi:Cadherin EGF LAG seven-pass G-type receptor 3 [Lamellibrachia satsuma]|nr:Cadherin EGF LAG seven-pass G-type receptor 3 [Lamellibrachia satsuma]
MQAICYSVAVWLHYACLASCSWLLSYAILLGHQLRQDDDDDDMCFYNSIGAAVPAIVVTISVLWRYQDYRDHDYCWLSSHGHLDWSFKVPVIFITTATAVVLVFVVKQLLSPAYENRRRQNPAIGSGIRACCVLLPFLSATWILCDYTTAMRTWALEIIFAITNSLLGLCVLLVMFIFNVELAEARRHGKKKRISKHKVLPIDEADYATSEKVVGRILRLFLLAAVRKASAGEQLCFARVAFPESVVSAGEDTVPVEVVVEVATDDMLK